MGKITCEVKEYGGWPNCIFLSNEIVELVITTDVGPRIISFGFVGEQNMFADFKEQIGTSGGEEWKMFGGHRLWLSPETKEITYEPDNHPIESWKQTDRGVVIVRQTEKNTGVQKVIEITLAEDGASVIINHSITNKSMLPIEFAVWALTAMTPGGIEIIPENTKKTGFLANRTMSLWDYTKLGDSRVTWGTKYISIECDPNTTEETPFKIGIPNEHGWAAYILNNNMFVKQYKHSSDSESEYKIGYPDFGCSYETYCCKDFIEMESLGQLQIIEPGEKASHDEVWSLYMGVALPENEDDIDKLTFLFN